MVVGVAQAAINLGTAVVVGAAIGFERQWRQRLAGLRTNTLVALGAASFVVFENLFSTEASPTQVAAQVVFPISRTPIALRCLRCCRPISVRIAYWSRL
jgi:putative Mg2+ transporter-C (MgtC) family protein